MDILYKMSLGIEYVELLFLLTCNDNQYSLLELMTTANNSVATIIAKKAAKTSSKRVTSRIQVFFTTKELMEQLSRVVAKYQS